MQEEIKNPETVEETVNTEEKSKKDKKKSYELYNHFISSGTEIFQIMMGIEEEFDVEIDEDTVAKIETVRQAYQAIGEKDFD